MIFIFGANIQMIQSYIKKQGILPIKGMVHMITSSHGSIDGLRFKAGVDKVVVLEHTPRWRQDEILRVAAKSGYDLRNELG
jgi:hypothetical protein